MDYQILPEPLGSGWLVCRAGAEARAVLCNSLEDAVTMARICARLEREGSAPAPMPSLRAPSFRARRTRLRSSSA
jgi:hypothetical protein